MFTSPRFTPLALSVCLLATAAFAAGAPKPVAQVEGIAEYRLPNGLQVLLFPDASKPNVTVNVTYFVGSKHEGLGETGMAHLLEHLLFKGTPTTPRIPQALTERGARPNGTTWFDRTNYFETLPASAENLKWALGFEADRMVNSFIAKKDLDSEMTVVRNELEMGENAPAEVLLDRVLSTAFLWHNYGKSTIGNRADLENVPISKLQAFYRKHYQPDNAMLVIAGRFDPVQALAQVKDTFGKLPKPQRKIPPTYTVEPTQDGEREVTVRRVGEVAQLAAAYHVPEGAHPDFAAIDVLTEVLGSVPSGRLHQSLVKTGKAASVQAFNFQLRDPGVLAVGAEIRKAQPLEEAQALLLKTVEGVGATVPSDEEVARARTRLLKEVELTLNSSERSAILLSEWAALGDWRMLFLHRDRLEKVSPADVQRVAQKYLQASNRTSGRFVPTTSPSRAEMPAPVDVAAQLQGYQGRTEVAAGEAFDPSPSAIELRTERLLLPSGIRLALLPKKTRGEMVRAQLNLRWGTEQSLQGKAEAADTVGALLMRGTQKHSRQEIKDALDRLKARVWVNGSATGATVTVETVRAHLPEVMGWVSEVLREPSFDAKEFAQLQEERLASLEESLAEPDDQAQNALRRALSPYPAGHPYAVKSLEEQVRAYKAVTLAQVKDFHRAFYGASHAELAVVGDFDAKAFSEQVQALLGDWKSPQPFVRVPAQYKDAEAVRLSLQTPDKANAYFVAAHNLHLRDSDPDYPALLLGNFLLGGGFLNSRLATRIRQKEGLSYGVGSQLSASALDESGLFMGYALHAPENTERLEAAFREELQKVLDKGFTSDELKKGRAGLLEYRQSARAQDGTLAAQLAQALYVQRTLAFDAGLEKKLAALTPKDVQVALAKHLHPAKLSQVRAGDFAKATAKNAGAAAP